MSREVNYERQLVEQLACMCKQGDHLARKLNFEYLEVPSQYDGTEFVDCHEYWACNGNFEMQMHMSLRLMKTIVRWQNMEVF